MKRQSDFQALSVSFPHLQSPIEKSLQVKPANSELLKFVQIGADATVLALSLLLSSVFSAQISVLLDVPWALHAHTHELIDSKRLMVLGAVCLTTICWFWGVLHHYTLRRPYWDEVRETSIVMLCAFVADATIAFLYDQSISRLTMLSFWGTAFVLLLTTRSLVKLLLLRAGLLSQPCIFIGQGNELRDALLAFDSEPFMGFETIALMHPVSNTSGHSSHLAEVYQIGHERSVPVFGLTEHVQNTLKKVRAKVVFVMGGPDPKLEEELNRIRQLLSVEREDVYLVPPVMGLPLHGMQSFNFFSHEVLLLRATSKLKNRSARFLKRLFDLIASTAALVMLSPLLLYVAWRIRKESPGPALFKQKRIGRDGVEFEIYKFRSMVLNADKVLEGWKHSNPALWREYVRNNFKLAEDPRITPIGRYIRRTSIDELPQLINVFRGDMSLVGPRPLLARELDAYGSSIDVYTNVRPGISGLWQISGRSTTTFDTRIALDRWYIRNWSFWHDIVILFKTVKVVFRSEGAY